MARQKRRIPLESEEQSALFQWARLMEGRCPELRLMYHIPNGGLRNKPVAVRLTAQGVRRGVPDICLPVARHGFHSLYIELKRPKGGEGSDRGILAATGRYAVRGLTGRFSPAGARRSDSGAGLVLIARKGLR